LPLAEADTDTVLVPTGVPGFPPPAPPPAHDVRLDATAKKMIKPKTRKLRSARFWRAAMPSIAAETRNRRA
jgi:hypothetical protein